MTEPVEANFTDVVNPGSYLLALRAMLDEISTTSQPSPQLDELGRFIEDDRPYRIVERITVTGEDDMEGPQPSKPWRVVQAVGVAVGRVLAEGSEQSMRRWVENHFPRVHVDSSGAIPKADVHLINPTSDTHEEYHGPEDEQPWKEVNPNA